MELPGKRPSRSQLLVGAILIGVGVVGLTVTLVAASLFGGPGSAITDGAGNGVNGLGESIFLTGIGEDGDPVPRTGILASRDDIGCASCHGPDGRGRVIRVMMRTVQSEDIRWSSLTEEDQSEEEEHAYTEASFAQAVREGTKPNGERLDPFMPRWELNDDEIMSLIDYLETL